jgi:hypothetical protein
MADFLLREIPIPQWMVFSLIALAALDGWSTRYFRKQYRQHFDEVAALARIAIREVEKRNIVIAELKKDTP